MVDARRVPHRRRRTALALSVGLLAGTTLVACSDDVAPDDVGTVEKAASISNAGATQTGSSLLATADATLRGGDATQGEAPQKPVNRPAPDVRGTMVYPGEPGYIAAGRACDERECTDEHVALRVLDQDGSVTAGTTLRELDTSRRAPEREPDARREAMRATSLATIAGYADACARGEQAAVVVHLDDPHFDFTRLRDARAELRGAELREALTGLRRERDAQLADGYEKLGEWVAAVDGHIVGTYTSSAAAVVELPACNVERMYAAPPVLGIGDANIGSQPHLDGNQRRAVLNLPDYGVPSITGANGGAASADPVRYGIIESDNDLNSYHVAFRNERGGTNRVLATRRCVRGREDTQCSGRAASAETSHGTTTTSILMADTLRGQDRMFDPVSPYRTNVEAGAHTGIAREAEAIYYSGDLGEELLAAVEMAMFEDGVDIINMSAGLTEDVNAWCTTDDPTGLLRGFEVATDAGVLVVVSAGNDGASRRCSLGTVATHPDTLAVGGIFGAESVAQLDGTPLFPFSSHGEFEVHSAGGGYVSARPVDLVSSAGPVHRVVGSGTEGEGSYIDLGEDIGGTSVSAPLVAGAAGLMLDQAYDIGLSPQLTSDPYVLRAMLAVLGDGRDSARAARLSRELSDGMGFGALRFQTFVGGMGPRWGYGVRRIIAEPGRSYEWQVGSAAAEARDIKGWKLATYVDANDWERAPTILTELIDTCPDEGGETLVAWDYGTTALRGRIRMTGAEMEERFHGRCLVVRITVQMADRPFALYAADYYYSDDRRFHDAD